jgi:hypothetical protein
MGLLTLAAACWGVGTVVSKFAIDQIPALVLFPMQLLLWVLEPGQWAGVALVGAAVVAIALLAKPRSDEADRHVA